MSSRPDAPLPRARVRAGALFARLSRGMLRGTSAPTQVLSFPIEDGRVTQRHAREVIDFCLRVGEAMLATGASSADAVATMLRLAAAYGVSGMHVDVTFTSIGVSLPRGADEDPITITRIVRIRTIDYTRLQNLYLLIEELTESDSPRPVADAKEELSAILLSPHPYRRWLVVSGKAILAAGVAVMFNASIVLVLVAAASAVLSDLITRQLGRLAVPAFFAQMAASASITAVAVLMFWLRGIGLELPGANQPTVIVISGIVMLLSGLGLTVAARDAIDGYYVTAAARGLEVVMLTLGLAIGISVTLGAALRFGLPVTVGTSLGSRVDTVPGVLGAAIIGLGFALTSYVRLALVPVMAVIAGLVFAVFQLVDPLTTQQGLAAAVAGAVAGALAYLIYRLLRMPEAATAMAGIIGLIPGLAVYRALYLMMDSSSGIMAALPELISALATGLGLAAGSTIGAFVARRVYGLDLQARTALRRVRPTP